MIFKPKINKWNNQPKAWNSIHIVVLQCYPWSVTNKPINWANIPGNLVALLPFYFKHRIREISCTIKFAKVHLIKTMTNISTVFEKLILTFGKVIILLLYIIYSGSDLKRPKINVNCYPFNNLILFLHTKHADLTSWKSSYQSILKSQNILPTWSIDIQHLTFGIMSCIK